MKPETNNDLMFLAHRVPYPPDKGDKIRSWHMLRHLATRYRVHLGCLYDDAGDAQHIAFLRGICETVSAVPLRPMQGRRRMLASLATGEALTVGRFRDRALQHWVDERLSRRLPERIFVFGSAMVSYVAGYRKGIRILDMVDVDSEKWRSYAARARAPMRQIYAREARLLFQLERQAAATFDATLFATTPEAKLFTSLAPETEQRITAVKNGIDLAFFDPASPADNPYPRRGPVAVFTGAMDYRPNIEAVSWFATDILPLLTARHPTLEFWIVGRDPVPAVLRLARAEKVVVTGEVADTRPYVAHADVAVAPMTIARGVQNKILEAMAMAKPVIATSAAGAAVDAVAGVEILLADTPRDFANAVDDVLSGHFAALGARARRRMERDYRWRFDAVDALFERATRPVAPAEA